MTVPLRLTDLINYRDGEPQPRQPAPRVNYYSRAYSLLHGLGVAHCIRHVRVACHRFVLAPLGFEHYLGYGEPQPRQLPNKVLY